MIGPTGVGKTEIARRLAKLARAPLIKIEASKFTEVGYVGRDVESIIRDLVDMAISMVREEKKEAVRAEAQKRTEEALLDLLLPGSAAGFSTAGGEVEPDSQHYTREKLRQKLAEGALDTREVEIEIEDDGMPQIEMLGGQGAETIGFNIKDMMPGLFSRKQKRTVPVAEARRLLEQQEAERLVDRQSTNDEARRRVEESGIVFLDEIDKICGRQGGKGGGGPDVSREGVQRDLLPIVEGTTVSTRYGLVKTDHILFIGAGAFHVAKPSDMIPELQGRFPIRVELDALTEDDFVAILTEPKSALTRQYRDLLATEDVSIEFTPEAIREIARMAALVNTQTENIGARRLATLVERILEEVSFEAPDMAGVTLTIDVPYVREALAGLVEDKDLSRYVL